MTAKNFIIGLAIGTIVMLMLFGCQSAPDRKAFQKEECYYFADCLYRNEKGDKSGCAMLGLACSDAMKEARTLDRLNFCEKNEFKNWNTNECRLFLNQK